MKKNIPLLKRLRTRFLRMRHPEHLNMKVIAVERECGAAMCLIGHTLELAGYKRKKRADMEAGGRYMLEFTFFTPNGGRVRDPFAAAKRELGLDHTTANVLFHNWSIETPEDAAAEIKKVIEEKEYVVGF